MKKEEYIPDLEFEFEHQYDNFDYISDEQIMMEQWEREARMYIIIEYEYQDNLQRERTSFDEYEDLLLSIENWNGEVLDV